MEWFIAVLAVAALGVAAMAAAGGMGQMAKDPIQDTYRQDLRDGPLTEADIKTLRFGIALRGYAMGQVDDVLDRLAHEIAVRDARIAELTGEQSRGSASPPAAVPDLGDAVFVESDPTEPVPGGPDPGEPAPITVGPGAADPAEDLHPVGPAEENPAP
jgi:DivIVA domain-containing protein